MDKYFYSPEWTTILNSLLDKLPVDDEFNLFDISKELKTEYKNTFTSWFSTSEKTYIDITNGLIANNLARLSSRSAIILTEEGKQLKELGSWIEYQNLLNLKRRATYWRTFRDAKWLQIAFIGYFLVTLSTLLIERGFERVFPKKPEIHQLKMDLVIPKDSVHISVDSILSLSPTFQEVQDGLNSK